MSKTIPVEISTKQLHKTFTTDPECYRLILLRTLPGVSSHPLAKLYLSEMKPNGDKEKLKEELGKVTASVLGKVTSVENMVTQHTLLICSDGFLHLTVPELERLISKILRDSIKL